MDFWTLRCDGAARGNPGPAAIGLVVQDPSGAIVLERGEAIGHTTNNIAEYRALIAGMEWLSSEGASHIEILCDSQLVVRQVEGVYKVKNAGLKPLHRQAMELVSAFQRVEIRHVPREENAAADALANKALDNTGTEPSASSDEHSSGQQRLF